MMYNPLMETALTIAGSDPTGGAGLQADLRVFHSLGVHGLAVVAALTAQSTLAVEHVYPVAEAEVKAQLGALLEDITPSALKTGMLFSAGAINAVVNAVRSHGLSNLVVDPVTRSTSGKELISTDAMDVLRSRLLPLAKVVTPNLAEASSICTMEVRSIKDMEQAAKALHAMGPEYVIITGGHLEGSAADMVFDGIRAHVMETSRHPGDYHGTGCVFSAAITALLALGLQPLEAARRAKELVADAIRDAFHPGRGMGILRL